MDPRATGREPSPPLPPLPPASRELLEVLWSAGRPLTTRQIHDAIARRYRHRAGRRINTTSSLLASLLETGWVVGRKRGGTRWVYEVAVSRDEGMRQLARRAVEEFCAAPGGGWYLVWAALEVLDLGAPRAAHPGERRAPRRSPLALR